MCFFQKSQRALPTYYYLFPPLISEVSQRRKLGKHISSVPHRYIPAVGFVAFTNYDRNANDKYDYCNQSADDPFDPRLLHSLASCPNSLPPVPATAACGNAEETTVPFFCIPVQKEVCATHLCRIPFAFSEQAWQAAFCSLYIHLRGKWGIAKGISLCRWVSNRGAQHPCWHTILLRKV